VNTSLLQLPGRRRDARAGLEDAVVAAELAKLLAEGPCSCLEPRRVAVAHCKAGAYSCTMPPHPSLPGPRHKRRAGLHI